MKEGPMVANVGNRQPVWMDTYQGGLAARFLDLDIFHDLQHWR